MLSMSISSMKVRTIGGQRPARFLLSLDCVWLHSFFDHRTIGPYLLLWVFDHRTIGAIFSCVGY